MSDVAPHRDRMVTSLVQLLLEAVFEHAGTTATYADPDVPTLQLESVTEFWRMVEGWERGVPEVRYIALRGAVSTFAPATPGVPRLKRDVHRAVRRDFEAIRKRLARTRGIGPTTVDAMMAFSAGQMVVKVAPADLAYAYLGLYHSIVRNSIPLFVKRDYFDAAVRPALAAGKTDAVDAYVIARLKPLTRHYFADFVKSVGLYDVFDASTLEQVAPRYGLEVDGDAHTRVVPLAPPRYLDGDIWVAIDTGKAERVVSRFVDLADAADLADQRQGLKADIDRYFAGGKVISEYDETDPLFAGPHGINPGVIRNRIFRKQRGAPPGAGGKPRGRTRPRGQPVGGQQIIVQNAERLVLAATGSEVRMGDQSFHFERVIGPINVNSILTGSTQTVRASTALDDDDRAKLEAALEELRRELDALQSADQAKRVATAADRLVTEAARGDPDKSFLRVSADGLKEAAQTVAAIAPSVVATVARIIGLLGL